MIFDIDVSGEDLLSKDYTICIVNAKLYWYKFRRNRRIFDLIKESENITKDIATLGRPFGLDTKRTC